jgi:hypothetical protein
MDHSLDLVAPDRAIPSDSGKALAALLIYLVAFTLTLFLSIRGFHFIAYLILFAVCGVLATWLRRVGRR